MKILLTLLIISVNLFHSVFYRVPFINDMVSGGIGYYVALVVLLGGSTLAIRWIWESK